MSLNSFFSTPSPDGADPTEQNERAAPAITVPVTLAGTRAHSTSKRRPKKLYTYGLHFNRLPHHAPTCTIWVQETDACTQEYHTRHRLCKPGGQFFHRTGNTGDTTRRNNHTLYSRLDHRRWTGSCVYVLSVLFAETPWTLSSARFSIAQWS
jgi:hypothetical protein